MMGVGGESVSIKDGPKKGGDHHWPAPKIVLLRADSNTMSAPAQATVDEEINKFPLRSCRIHPMDGRRAGGQERKERQKQVR